MADSIAPDFGQHIDPDGRVTYDFDGHIHARGLDLDAGGDVTPTTEDRIRWLSTSGGGLVAQLFAYELAGKSHVELLADKDGAAIAALEANAVPTDAAQTALTATAVATEAAQATIIAADGSSSFAQLLGATARSQMIAGGVTDAGATNYGTGFTVARVGVGLYQLTYEAPFLAQPAFIVGTDQGSPLEWSWTTGTGSALTGPRVATQQGGVLADSFWSFFAIALF